MDNKEVTLTIDSAQVAVPEGTTIFRAAASAGIEIPHLCYDPDLDLPPNASCRLCLVEVEGAAAPVASCTHQVAPGMVVKTDTPELHETRRMILDLLLSDHPHDCATCEQSGACPLEEYAYAFGLRERATAAEAAAVEPAGDAPMIDYNRTRCILCGRCVSVCQGIQEADAIDYLGRGFEAEIGLPPGLTREDSDCELCGNCTVVCPTGGIRGKFVPRSTDVGVRTTCGYCGVGCQLSLIVRGGQVAGVTTDGNNPINGRWLCVKGRFGHEFIHHPDRLTTPLIRRKGRLEEADWDEAMEYVASRMGEIKAEHGPDALAFMSSSRCSNEENYLMEKLARAVIGTNNVDQCART